MPNIQILSKDSQDDIFNAEVNRVSITQPAIVKISTNIENVANIKRLGNNAIVVMKNGEKIVIDGFFSQKVTTNALVFENAEQQLTWVQFTRSSSLSQTVYYENIESIEPLLDTGFFNSIGPWTYALGGVLVAGGAAALAGGGGGGSSGGNAAAINVTQNNADGLAGTAKAGSTIVVTVNGNTQTALVDSAGKWSLKPNPIGENQTASISERQADGTVLATVQVSRGDDAPATPTVAASVSDDQAPVVGNVSNNSTTNDNLPRLSGTASKGDIITIYDNSNAIGSTTVADNGTWSFTPSTALSEGQHILTYTAKDAGGKESAKSPAITITVDTQADAAATNAPSISDDQAPNTGNIANGASSNDAKPTISGSGSPNNIIKIYIDDVINGSVTVAANGSWSYTPSGNLSDGSRTIYYTSTDAAGNESAKSPSVNVMIDTTKPATPSTVVVATDDNAPILGNISSGGISNDAQPTFSGTGNAGEIITLLNNGITLGSVTVAANGTWRFTPATPLSEGSHSISYTVTDIAGNQSSASSPFNFNIDSTVPTAVLKITSISDDTDLGGDFITSDSSLTINGTVTGLGSFERVQISVDNGQTWSDVTLNASVWRYSDPRILANGDYTYQVRVIDTAGNSSAVVSQVVKVDTSLINSAISIQSIGDDTGILGDFITRDNVISINGTVSNLVNGQKAQISLDNGNSWIDLTVSNGTWRYDDTRGLNDGNVVYRVRVVSSDGSIEGARDQRLVTIDSTVPAQPSSLAMIQDDQSPTTGNLSNNAFSNDRQPTISGTGVAKDIVLIYDNNVLLGSVTVADNGQWTFTPSAALSEGSHSISYAYKDVAGNESARSGSIVVNVDVTAPSKPSSAPTISDGLAPVTGTVSSGGSTNDTKPIISGIGAVAGEIIQIYDADRVIASVVAVGDGSWSYTPSDALSEGTHTFSYTRTDAAGNQSERSAVTSIKVDTTAPNALIEVLSISDDTGIAGDFKTADSSITLNGSVSNLASDERLQISLDGQNWVDLTLNFASWSYTDTRTLSNGSYNYQIRAIDAAGNAAAPISKIVTIDTTLPAATIRINSINDDTGIVGDYVTSDSSITLNGNVAGLSTGENAQISVDNGQTWIDLTLSSNSWSYSDTRILNNQSYNYQVRIVDSNGNAVGASDAKTVTIDTVAPTAPTAAAILTDDVTPNLGTIANSGVTNDTQPLISGAGATANTVIRILDNGISIGSTLSNASGAWSFTPSSALSEGAHAISYAYLDVAGNQSAAAPAVNFTVDTTAPVLKIAINSISDDTGNAGDFLTSDNTLTVNGSVTGLQAGERLQISIDGGTWSDLTISNNSWSYTDSRTLENGTYTYLVRGIDSAGNVSQTVSRQVTVDTSAPTASIRISSISDDAGTAGDFLTNDTSLTINGTVTGLLAGQKAQISVDGVNWQNLTVNNGTWIYTDPRTLSTGTVTYHVRVVNSTETSVGATASQVVVIDTSAPTYSSAIQIVRDSNNDGFINSTEQNASTTTDVNITISSSAQNGDVIMVKNGNITLASYTVGQDGVTAGSSKLITGISLPSQGSALTITAETRDAAGNLSSVISSDSATMSSNANNPALQQGSNNADTLNGNSNNNWFEGLGGNDVFNLGLSGGQDTLFYKVLNSDATGGNGTDILNNFALGNTTSNFEADKIDLKDLLINYTADSDGAARFVNGVASIDSGDTISQYLSLQVSGGNTTLFIDRDGSGTAFSSSALLTLNNVTGVDLATLLANQQIIIA